MTITAEHVAAGHAELGEIEVGCRSGPRVGSDMRAIEFADASGRVRYVDDMRGRYVLLHAWATWCGPCVASMAVLWNRQSLLRYPDSRRLNIERRHGRGQIDGGNTRIDFGTELPGS